ncbi:MAG: hypothetical protein WC554_11695 [Clostridia bacterium]|jgi:transcriptional regulator with XRE-family HTH domain
MRAIRAIREEIEVRGGRARVWVGPGRVEVIDAGLTPEWALRGQSERIEIDVDLDDDSEDWWPDVEQRIERARAALNDELIARLLQVVAEHPDDQRTISQRAGQRPGWLASLLQAWRGHGRRGAEPTLSTLRLLAQGLGCTLGELLGPELLDRRGR